MAEGVLTVRGGATSHAVVARQFGKPCVCGLSELNVNEEAKTIIGGRTIAEGDAISIDGCTGEFLPILKHLL